MIENQPADTKPASSDPQTGNAPDKSGTAERTFTQAELETILAERLTRAEKKHADALAKREQEAAEKAAKEQGQWQKLAEQYEPKAKQAEDLLALAQETLAAELAGVPEKLRDLIPAGDVRSQLTWLRKAKAAGILVMPAAPNTDAGQFGNNKAAAQEADEIEVWERLGFTNALKARQAKINSMR